MNNNKNMLQARKTIMRAEKSFQISGTKSLGDLVIENDRLKISIDVLN